MLLSISAMIAAKSSPHTTTTTTTTTSLSPHTPFQSLSAFSLPHKPFSSSSLTNRTSQNPNFTSNHEFLHQVNHTHEEEEEQQQQPQQQLVRSASAVAEVIRRASAGSDVEFVQRVEEGGKKALVLPSSDFQRLCSEQLDLFRRIVGQETVLSVYVRPADSYVMDRLELQRIALYPERDVVEKADIVVLIGTFGITTGLRVAESSLSNQQVEVIHDYKAVVFPMVKHPFVVGFLVAEFPTMEFETWNNVGGNGQDLQLSAPHGSYALPMLSERNQWELDASKDPKKTFHHFSAEQRSSVVNISRSLATAYVMDQKTKLLQQSSWQNNIRMNDLTEQIRGSLSNIRSMSKMLSAHMKRSEIPYDIVEDILVQGDQMKDTLQQLQDAVYLTKVNILRYNEEASSKMKHSTYSPPETESSQLLDDASDGSHTDKTKRLYQAFPRNSAAKDMEMPMPPLALAPLRQHNIRPCNVSDVLADLVEAAGPLAHKLQRTVELIDSPHSLQVSIEESALRQALSNLIEGALLRIYTGGKVEIVSTGAPAGGVLVLIDDDGPDMHYMAQMHALTPFGPDLISDGIIEDNMTWNFVSGLTVAREILESYGCVVRAISPRNPDAVFGAGGTRIELWFPSHNITSESTSLTQEA